MSIPTPTGFAYRRTEYRYVALYRDGFVAARPGDYRRDSHAERVRLRPAVRADLL